MLLEVAPGTIGLSGAGKGVAKNLTAAIVYVGQKIINVDTRYCHAFIYIGDGKVVEATLTGAKISRLDAQRDVAFIDLSLSAEQQTAVVDAAKSFVGVPYSYWSFWAIGAMRLRLPARYLKKRASRTNAMICSQLVYEAYKRAGIQLFPRIKESYQVAPGDLIRLLRLA